MTSVPDPRFGYPDLGGTTVLVVDDHQDSLDFLRDLLRFCGAEVMTAWSTAHARARLEVRVPSLIVCDFQLPRETGVAFLRWLREQPDERARIPAIAITAYPDAFLRAGDGVHDFDAYFTKPLDVPRFLRTVGAIVARPPAGRSPRRA